MFVVAWGWLIRRVGRGRGVVARRVENVWGWWSRRDKEKEKSPSPIRRIREEVGKGMVGFCRGGGLVGVLDWGFEGGGWEGLL